MWLVYRGLFELVFESLGNSSDSKKTYILRYFREIFLRSNENVCWLYWCDSRTLNIPFFIGTSKRYSENIPISLQTWPRVYKTFFMLNATEHELFHANKSQITDNCKFFLAKH